MKRSNLYSQRSPILRAFVLTLAVMAATACNKKDEDPKAPPAESKEKSHQGDSAGGDNSPKSETATTTPKAAPTAPSIVPTEPGATSAPSPETATQAEKDAAAKAAASKPAQSEAAKEDEVKRKLDEGNAAPASRDQLLAAMGTPTPLTVMYADFLASKEEDLGNGALQIVSAAFEDGTAEAPVRIAELNGDMERLIKSGLFVGAVKNRSALLNTTLDNRIDRLENRAVIQARRHTLYVALISGALGTMAGAKGFPALQEEANRILQMSTLKAGGSMIADGVANFKANSLEALLGRAPKIVEGVAADAPQAGQGILAAVKAAPATTWGYARAAGAMTFPVQTVSRKLIKVLQIPEVTVKGEMGLSAVTNTDLKFLQFTESRLPGLSYAVTTQQLGINKTADGLVKVVFKYQPVLTNDTVRALTATREVDMKTAENFVAQVAKRPGAPEEFAVAVEADGLHSTELPADKVDLSDLVDKRTPEAMAQSIEVEPTINLSALKVRAAAVKGAVAANLAADGKLIAQGAAKTKSLLVPDLRNFDVRWAGVTAGASFTLIKSAMWYQSKVDASSSVSPEDIRDTLIPIDAVPDSEAATEVPAEQAK